ncbi:ATP-dependent helicase HrpB [hydrothermal vent metagenome]|uniref:ATP-dependent helicase HrpB n=1 Tax=hydrothermal vent metagenome TaxID=652676 RepID=A0A3B0X0C9_9ZZZZ
MRLKSSRTPDMTTSPLPVSAVIPDITSALTTRHRVVLQAPPGAGKTTAVPIALLSEAWLKNRQIIMLEPRRLAARNAAARMAYLLGEDIGETIGFQIRQHSCFSKRTRILIVTEGILTRKLQTDPELKNTALIIFDEFHERSIHTDLSLALCLQSQEILNAEFRLLIMSATLDTEAISSLLNTHTDIRTPVIESTGRSFPVDIQYIEKTPHMHHSSNSKNTGANQQQLILGLFEAVRQVILEQDSSCLVFLPGKKEIDLLEKKINQYLKAEGIQNIFISPLFANLNQQQQDEAIQAPPSGRRKFVLATNIAETSLTIEGINCVIDSGLEKVMHYTSSCAMNKLKTQFISQDSATQRSGRAGRLAPGTCYRLWTKHQHSRLIKHSTAEILHSDLSALVLELANWGVKDPGELQWIDTPPESAIKHARKLLRQLNAIDSDEKITHHGQKMLQLGSHPRLSHMMISSIAHELPHHACLIAALLDENDIFQSSMDKSTDINDRLNFLIQMNTVHIGDRQNKSLQNINIHTCRRIKQSANDYLKKLEYCTGISHTGKTINSQNTGVLLAYAYPDRIAQQRQPDKAQYLLSNGKGCFIPDFVQTYFHPLLVTPHLDDRQGEARIFLSAEITEEQLETYFSDNINLSESLSWNEKQQRVECKQTRSIGQIVLRESLIQTSDKEAIHQCLLSAIQTLGLKALDGSSQALNLQHRVQFINSHIKHKNAISNEIALPDFSDETLLNSLNEWLLPHLTHENSIKQCQKLDLHTLLTGLLSWNQLQYINTVAPERISVPSGSAIQIDYSDISQPVLAVRLQEVFGLNDTPSIFHGQCKLMMHLLSPARRPVQITQDLHSFWQTTYHDVKKELCGKYKKHYWPDNPLTAKATSKTRKNMH